VVEGELHVEVVGHEGADVEAEGGDVLVADLRARHQVLAEAVAVHVGHRDAGAQGIVASPGRRRRPP
jgi:hypothetical protein